MERTTRAVYPGLTANYDIARLLPLGAAALQHRQSAGAYAGTCIDVASALADALAAEGLDVVTCERGPTSSHHVAVDVRAFGGGPEAARTLAAANVLLSEIGLPGADRDPQGAIRVGTQTIVRQGLGTDDMAAVAAVIAGALREERPADALRAEVAEIRRAQ
jgi:glycine hydroxymethyltransferase